jgi:hypothetical protein
VRDQISRRRAADASHAVMLGKPIARVAKPLGHAGEIDRLAHGIGGGCASERERDRESNEESQWLSQFKKQMQCKSAKTHLSNRDTF